jgi:sugar/nucleoside kinase (ribokinase family)
MTMDKILCVGDLVADFFASPVPRLPQSGELVLCDSIEFQPGGNALNMAIVLRKMGENVAFAGSVGDDDIGELLLAKLQRIGLETSAIRREPGGKTASTIIMRAEGEDRRFLHCLGVGSDFTGEHIPPEAVPENGILIIGGYLKMKNWNDAALEKLLREARRRNTKTLLNVCIAKNSDVDINRCLRLLPHVDFFVPNEDEARILTGEKNPEKQVASLRKAGAGTVIITRGSRGLHAQNDQCCIHMGVYPVPVVDPSGCGDCFAAGLAAALLRGWDLPKALTFGSAVGSLGVMALGCTTGVPEFSEVIKFMEQNQLPLNFYRQAECSRGVLGG